MRKPKPILLLEHPRIEDVDAERTAELLMDHGYLFMCIKGPVERLRILSVNKLPRKDRERILAAADAIANPKPVGPIMVNIAELLTKADEAAGRLIVSYMPRTTELEQRAEL